MFPQEYKRLLCSAHEGQLKDSEMEGRPLYEFSVMCV